MAGMLDPVDPVDTQYGAQCSIEPTAYMSIHLNFISNQEKSASVAIVCLGNLISSNGFAFGCLALERCLVLLS